MVIPRWLRSKLVAEPTMKDLRERVQQEKAEITEHTSFIVEKVQAKKSGRTMELSPSVGNGTH